jgi:hypothetical protein
MGRKSAFWSTFWSLQGSEQLVPRLWDEFGVTPCSGLDLCVCVPQRAESMNFLFSGHDAHDTSAEEDLYDNHALSHYAESVSLKIQIFSSRVLIYTITCQDQSRFCEKSSQNHIWDKRVAKKTKTLDKNASKCTHLVSCDKQKTALVCFWVEISHSWLRFLGLRSRGFPGQENH